VVLTYSNHLDLSKLEGVLKSLGGGWLGLVGEKEVGCHSSHKKNKELRNCAIRMKKLLELLT
jgi:hypothetical protein